MAKKSAPSGDPVGEPRDRAKAVHAARLRLLGYTFVESAKGARVGLRTLKRWEECSWWRGVVEEARVHYLGEVEAAARMALLSSLSEGDGSLALRVLERLDPALRPPSQRHEVTGADGGPIEVRQELPVGELSDAALAELEAALGRQVESDGAEPDAEA